MKSIKEKSNEYAKEYLFSTLPQRAPNVHFEAGANYVLDVIEDVLNHPRIFVSADISISEAIITEITKIVEQLKK
jgi:hypothetical protein